MSFSFYTAGKRHQFPVYRPWTWPTWSISIRYLGPQAMWINPAVPPFQSMKSSQPSGNLTDNGPCLRMVNIFVLSQNGDFPWLFIAMLITGWWFQPLWKILVSWDYYSQYIRIYMEKWKIFQTTNQITINQRVDHNFRSPLTTAHCHLHPWTSDASHHGFRRLLTLRAAQIYPLANIQKTMENHIF